MFKYFDNMIYQSENFEMTRTISRKDSLKLEEGNYPSGVIVNACDTCFSGVALLLMRSENASEDRCIADRRDYSANTARYVK